MSPDGLKPPPEERLLRLIRGKIGHAAGGGAASSSPHGAAPAVAIASRTRPFNWSQGVVVALIAIVSCEVVWVVVQLVRPLPPVPVPAVAAVPSTAAATSTPPEAGIPSVAANAARPLFTAPASGEDELSSGRSPMSGSAKVLAGRLTLTGIVDGTIPQAIIEDTQTQKTYLVSVGQPLAEGAVLDQILDNRVILDFNGEKVELAL